MQKGIMQKGSMKFTKILFAFMAFVLATASFATLPVYANPSNWARDAVSQGISAGLVPANLQSNYQRAITRAEFASLAVALYENRRGTVAGRQQFTDTNDVNVQKAAYIGIVTGVGNNRFAPGNTINRQEAAVMISRLATAIGSPLQNSAPSFADNSSMSNWAREGIGQVQAAGIMGGVGNNRFDPAGQYTREQSIVSIMRLYTIATGGQVQQPPQQATPAPAPQPEPTPPTPAPEPAPTPAAQPQGVRQRTRPAGGDEAYFEYTRSSITMQNRRMTAGERHGWVQEYIANGGASWFEFEVHRLVNVERTNAGLNTLAMCHMLNMASRYYSQIMANLNTNLGHTEGPYGGSFEVADALGDVPVGMMAGNAIAGYWTPAEAVAAWMASPGHRANLLDPAATRMGTGFHLGGQWGVFGYQLFGGGSATPIPV